MNELDSAEQALANSLEALNASGGDDPAADVARALAGFEAAGTAALASCASARDLDAVELKLLRQKGALNAVLRSLGKLPPQLRKDLGQKANELRRAWEADVAAGRERLGASAAAAAPAFDVTLPGRRPFEGHPHVLHQVRDRILEVFRGMGYSVATGPEVEDDHHNFAALNFGPHHPARDAHDTLFLETGALLRTHTSPVQIRTMRSVRPPIRMVFPGRVYRAEQIDATHAAEFHQIEGLYVDRGVSMAHLKGTLAEFARGLFGVDARIRFRPSYFPFTEPSGEVDVSCFLCGGSGRLESGARCNVCKGSGWIEILGCGMVHPNVFRAVGYDPEEWTGFAFGMGFERITMLLHGIPDIRHLLENDMRFLEQF